MYSHNLIVNLFLFVINISKCLNFDVFSYDFLLILLLGW
jgi:hypothetical protein